MAWQFSAPDPEKRERIALKVIAISFFGLAAYVFIDAALSLFGAREAQHSPVAVATDGAVAARHALPQLG